MKFKDKKILIVPYSEITRKLALFLKLKEYALEPMFIDKNAKDNGIYSTNDIQNIDFDYIFIYSRHAIEIYNEYIKYGVLKKRIIFVLNDNGKYKFFRSKLRYQLEKLKNEIFNKTNKETFNFFIAKSVSKIYSFKTDKTVFISRVHFDSNIKYLYLYMQNNGIKTTILSSNQDHINSLKKYNYECLDLSSIKGQIYLINTTKIITADGGKIINKKRVKSDQDIVQLVHGVLIKNVPDQRKINHYKYFFTTSNNVINNLYKNKFSAERFLNYGHPRNDVLFNDISNKQEELFCDMDIYKLIKDKDKKVIVYAPTFRTYSFDDFPISFHTLNQFLKEIGAIFIIKLHNQIYKDFNHYIFEEAAKYENILLHSKNNDIYPILNKTDVLISDYSSIAYDFLILNRPMLFLTYDKERYVSTRGDFSFDYDEYTPGAQVNTQNELHNEISNIFDGVDLYKQKRLKLLDYYYDYTDNQSSKRIMEQVCSSD